MAHYLICSQTGDRRSLKKDKVDESIISDEDFTNYELGTLDKDRESEIMGIAMENQRFEWWIEKEEGGE